MGVTVKFWEDSKEPGEDAWPTIQGWIDSADIVLVLATKSMISRAKSVGNEVGWAKSKGKTIIPIIERGVSSNELGMLAGITYIPLDRDEPEKAAEPIRLALERVGSRNAVSVALILILAGFIIWALVSE